MALVGGFRGAVELSAGTFHTGGPVRVAAGGVVVRGTGSGRNGTVIRATGGALFDIGGSGTFTTGGAVELSGTYIPSGSISVAVKDASSFQAGDEVVITKVVTKEWIAFMGMDTLVRDSADQVWLTLGTKLNTVRNVVAVSGNRLAFDAPLSDDFDAAFTGNALGTVALYAFPGRIENAGLEGLRIIAPADAEPFAAVSLDAAKDCWIDDVAIEDGTGNVRVGQDTRRVTVRNVTVSHSVPSVIVAKPFDFICTGTQALFDRCSSSGKGSWPWSTGGRGTGPIVVLNFRSTQDLGITPHMRWTTGILADCDTLPDAPKNNPGLSYRNRATAGSGHGWTTGWSVAWNVVTPYFLVSKPPGTLNWAIGGKGTKTSLSDSDGIYDHPNTIVEPKSLYLKQLEDRLGPQALDEIGYGKAIALRPPRPDRGFSPEAARRSGTVILAGPRGKAPGGPVWYEADGQRLRD